MTPKARKIQHDDAERLRAFCDSRTGAEFAQLRTAALVAVAWGGALRLSEVLALNLDQILMAPRKEKLGKLRPSAFLAIDQSKLWGPFILTPWARAILLRYLRALDDRGWLTLPEGCSPPHRPVPLFLTIKGGHTKEAPSRTRLGKRAAQLCFEQLLQAARVPSHYRFGDLRHDALLRVGEASKDPFTVAQFGRFRDTRTAAQFVQREPHSLAKLSTYTKQ